MLMSEWIDLTGHEPSPEQWEMITVVYNFHPSIPDVGGKKMIIEFYKAGGLGLIMDMYYTASSIVRYEDAIREAEAEVIRLGRELESRIGELKAEYRRKIAYYQQLRNENKAVLIQTRARYAKHIKPTG